MKKKYKLLKRDKIEYSGRILYRIKALRSFGNVDKGELGGYVESENNLSHEGDCWIYNNAKAYDNAKVFGDAKIYDESEVFGNAEVFGLAVVYGKARVYGNAEIGGRAEVFDTAEVCEDAKVYGEANVFGNAEVRGLARVYGNAWVFGNAKVFGDAKIYGEANVFGNAEVFGLATVCGNARVLGNARIKDENHVITGYIKDGYDTIRYELAKQLGITTSGNKVRLFKRVNKIKKGVYASIYDDNFIYKDGKVAKVKYYDPSNTSCSDGLHCSTALYWDKGDTLIEVEVDLKDIITVQQGKVRCKKLKVIGEVDFSK